jgi:hypothetical protein
MGVGGAGDGGMGRVRHEAVRCSLRADALGKTTGLSPQSSYLFYGRARQLPF